MDFVGVEPDKRPISDSKSLSHVPGRCARLEESEVRGQAFLDPTVGRIQRRSNDQKPLSCLTCTSQNPSPSSSLRIQPAACRPSSWP